MQDEIMASLTNFKSSLLSRKGGFLHNYAMLEASTSAEPSTQVSPVSTPIKVIPPTPSRAKSSMKNAVKTNGTLKKLKDSGTKSDSGTPTNTINISLPSPAGSMTKSKKSAGVKKWDKYR